ncbi:MAG: ATP-binding protein, partial [Bacteroidota bacterium]
IDAILKAHLYRDLCQTNYFNLYEIYQNKEEYQKALGFLEMGVSFQDSIYNEKQTKRITELQFKYDVAKSEKEIHTLQLRQNQIMFLGFLILFGVVILFLVSILAIRGKSANVLKRKSKEIQIQNVKLKESNEVLKQFAYVAAHDLKEPLRNIGSFVNLLKKRYGSNFNSEAQEYMGFVTNGARRMNNLLEDLLEYSRISAQAPTREFIDIYEVVNEVSSNLKEKIRRQNARIDCAEDLPKMRMNHLHLVQLFQNLISNAMKFVDGPPIIRISGKTENGYTTISIQDNGIGIDKEFGHKIFNLFHQLNKNKKYEGTGIGLTIVKNIVDKYDGKIWFESEINQGTTFFISIPVDDAQAAPTATVNEKAQVAFAQN